MLKSLGFRRRPILLALLAESTLQALIGGLVGAGGAYGIFTALAAAGKTGDERVPRPARRSFQMSPAVAARGRGDRARRRARRRRRAGVERRAPPGGRGAPAPLLTMPIPLAYNVRNLARPPVDERVQRGRHRARGGGDDAARRARRRAPAACWSRPASPTTWSSCARAPPTTARARCRATPRRRSARMTGVARGAGRRAARVARAGEPAVHASRASGGRENVLVRGVEPVAFDVHRGRPPRRRAHVPAEARRGRDRHRRRARATPAPRLGERDRVRPPALDASSASSTRAAPRSTARSGPTSPTCRTTRGATGYSGVRLTRRAGHRPSQALVRRIEADGRFTLEAKPEVDVLPRAGRDGEHALRPRADARRRHGDGRRLRRAQHDVRRGGEPHARRSARCARSASPRGAILRVVPHRVAAARRRRPRRRARRSRRSPSSPSTRCSRECSSA